MSNFQTKTSNVKPKVEQTAISADVAIPAKSEVETTVEDKPEKTEREKLYPICREIAERESILDDFVNDCKRDGMVGEEKICKLIYLALTTRMFNRPVSVAVKGTSSGGKSFVVDKVLSFFPSPSYLFFSAMSEKAIIYSKESYVHRFLIFAEADGVGDRMEYFIRTLLSEGKIDYEVTVEDKVNGGHKTQKIIKEGPTGLIITTTRVKLHPENETRIISVTVSDSRDQAKEVLRKLAEEYSEDIDKKRWMAFHEWLDLGPKEVVIPYAAKLAELTRPDAPRMKRDFHALLNLIRAHAVIHQQTRARDSQGRIVANEKDYQAAHEIVSLFIAEGVEQSVSTVIRETVQAVEDILKRSAGGPEDMYGNSDACSVSLGEIANYLKLDKSTVSRRIKSAISSGYLINLSNRRGVKMEVKLGESLPEDQEVIPSPEKLFEESEE